MKKEEKTELTKEKIITAAIEEFGTKGYAASSLNSICKNFNISKGLIYHNFENKDKIYLSCISKCFLEVIKYLESENIEGDLHRYMELRFAFFSKYPLYARLFFEAVLEPPSKLINEIKEIKKGFDELNKKIYKSALKTLNLRTGITEKDALEYYELMLEMFNGYFSSSAYANTDFTMMISDHEQKLKKILNFMIYGIAKEVE